MNKKKITKITTSLAVIIACCLIGNATSIAAPADSIGKQDPFEKVRPIADFKKTLVSKIGAGEESQFIETAPELYIESVMLKFLQAANLEQIAAAMISDYGRVTVDTNTNSLIICDARDNVDRIIEQIKKVDSTPKQIVIEVVIINVKLDDSTEIGVNWNFDSDNPTITYDQTLIDTLAGAATRGMDFGFINNSIDLTIHALQEVRDVEILSSPKILVLSGQQASIQTIEEIPYTELSETSEGGSLTSTQFKEVGVTLTVTATIMDDNKILLNVAPEQSVNTGRTEGGNTVPIVDSRKAQTTLLMNDGQVAVLGGLRSQEIRQSHNKIPLLGDLPLIGFLFSNDSEEIVNSELIVFISPHIYDDGQMTPEEMNIFNDLRDRPHLKLNTSTRPEFDMLNEVFPSYLKED